MSALPEPVTRYVFWWYGDKLRHVVLRDDDQYAVSRQGRVSVTFACSDHWGFDCTPSELKLSEGKAITCLRCLSL